jgi:hypothetical protein
MRVSTIVLLLALTTSAVASAGLDALLKHAVAQWETQPETRIEDAYKWLFHATQGGEHAITSIEGPRQWLEGEWKTLQKPHPGEKLIVPLRPDGSLVRLNLRPFKARGGSKERLLTAFVSSAKSFKATKSSFIEAWNLLGARLKKARIGKLTSPEWLRMDKEMRPLGFPACHHSEAYEKAYRPAYRVLSKPEAQAVISRR